MTALPTPDVPPDAGQAHKRAAPIIAISSNGTVTKANVAARRALAQQSPLEHSDLGSILASVMKGTGLYPQQILLQRPASEGAVEDILLVLSDQEASPPAETELPREVAAPPPNHPPANSNDVAEFIAHELRNRIAISMGLSQVLQTNFDSIEPDERRSALRSIQVECEQALMVLDGLLRIVDSRRNDHVAGTAVPVHSIVRRIVAEHKRRYPDRQIEAVGDAPVFAAGDSTWMQIAIANLVANAEKVTPREETIQISVRQAGNRVVIVVLDHGKALADQQYQGLWDIYAKGPPEGIEISGTGIGIAICKELVGSMGGRVWAGPRRNGGSAFAISLPGSPDLEAGSFDLGASNLT